MKDYLKENIGFNKLLFSSVITILTLLIGGTLGLVIYAEVSKNIKIISSLAGVILTISLVIYLIIIFNDIKSDLLSLKNHE